MPVERAYWHLLYVPYLRLSTRPLRELSPKKACVKIYSEKYEPGFQSGPGDSANAD